MGMWSGLAKKFVEHAGSDLASHHLISLEISHAVRLLAEGQHEDAAQNRKTVAALNVRVKFGAAEQRDRARRILARFSFAQRAVQELLHELSANPAGGRDSLQNLTQELRADEFDDVLYMLELQAKTSRDAEISGLVDYANGLRRRTQ